MKSEGSASLFLFFFLSFGSLNCIAGVALLCHPSVHCIVVIIITSIQFVVVCAKPHEGALDRLVLHSLIMKLVRCLSVAAGKTKEAFIRVAEFSFAFKSSVQCISWIIVIRLL